jgi:hypothetical protein
MANSRSYIHVLWCAVEAIVFKIWGDKFGKRILFFTGTPPISLESYDPSKIKETVCCDAIHYFNVAGYKKNQNAPAMSFS